MTTDNERREVARRLRECRDLREFAEALGFSWDVESDWTWRDVAARLADLIEPPARCPHYMYPCCRTDAGGDYIDRDALLSLADEMTVEKGDIWRWSSRIREALGVTDG